MIFVLQGILVHVHNRLITSYHGSTSIYNIKCFVFQIVVNSTMSTVSVECPTNETSWMQRSTEVCSNSQEYHCLPLSSLSKSEEYCLTAILVQHGTNIIQNLLYQLSIIVSIFRYFARISLNC